MSGADFLAELREELVRAAVRQQRRRAARPRIAAAATLVCVAAAGAIAVARPAPAQADVQVVVHGGRVAVTLHDLEHDPAEIEAATHRAGLRVEVVAVPVGPSQVGRFVGDAARGSLPPAIRPVDETGPTFAGFSVPAGWPGALELRVGRPARCDEPYARFSDALAPGEPLACQDLLGHPAGEVAGRLTGSRLTLRVEAVDEGRAQLLPLDAVRTGDHAGWVVVRADATSRATVVLRIQAVPPPRLDPPPC